MAQALARLWLGFGRWQLAGYIVGWGVHDKTIQRFSAVIRDEQKISEGNRGEDRRSELYTSSTVRTMLWRREKNHC